MLFDMVENHCASRHVNTHGKSLRGEEELDPTSLEEHLYDLLEDGQYPAVVDADAPLEQLHQLDDLRQSPVGALETLYAALHKVVDVALLHRRRQVQARQQLRILVTACPETRRRNV